MSTSTAILSYNLFNQVIEEVPQTLKKTPFHVQPNTGYLVAKV